MDRPRFHAALAPMILSAASCTGIAGDSTDNSRVMSAVVRVTISTTGTPFSDGEESVRAGHGSGFFVDDHHVVTNLHVIKDALSGSNALDPYISLEDSADLLPVAIIHHDPTRDLALLRFDDGSAPGKLSIAPDGDSVRGMRVFAFGYPQKNDAFSRSTSSMPSDGFAGDVRPTAPNPYLNGVRLFFVGGPISLSGGGEAGGNWIRQGVVRSGGGSGGRRYFCRQRPMGDFRWSSRAS